VKIGDDPTAIPAFHTAVLSSNPEQTGVSMSGVAGSELVVVRNGNPVRRIMKFADVQCSDCRRATGSDGVPVWALCDDESAGNPGYTDGL
jgi:hypothetical protein